jgi:hypothetical protein
LRIMRIQLWYTITRMTSITCIEAYWLVIWLLLRKVGMKLLHRYQCIEACWLVIWLYLRKMGMKLLHKNRCMANHYKLICKWPLVHIISVFLLENDQNLNVFKAKLLSVFIRISLVLLSRMII